MKETNENYFQEILQVIKLLNLQQMIFVYLFVYLFVFKRTPCRGRLEAANKCDFDRTNTSTRNQDK